MGREIMVLFVFLLVFFCCFIFYYFFVIGLLWLYENGFCVLPCLLYSWLVVVLRASFFFFFSLVLVWTFYCCFFLLFLLTILSSVETLSKGRDNQNQIVLWRQRGGRGGGYVGRGKEEKKEPNAQSHACGPFPGQSGRKTNRGGSVCVGFFLTSKKTNEQ